MNIRSSMLMVFMIPVIAGSIVVGVIASYLINSIVASVIIGWLSSGVIAFGMIIFNAYFMGNSNREAY